MAWLRHGRGRARGRARRLRCALGLAVSLIGGLAVDFGGGPAAAADDDLLVGLKAAYLFNFTRFIDWPAAAVGERFRVCVIDDPALAAALSALERRGEVAAGRPIRVQRVGVDEALQGAPDCQILYLGAAAVAPAARIIDAVAGRPLLTVGDSPGLGRAGVAINFVRRPDILGAGERLRFEINPQGLQGRGLAVSAQLYEVAEVLR